MQTETLRVGPTGRYHKRRALAASKAEKLGHVLIGWTVVASPSRQGRGIASIVVSSCERCGAMVEIDRKTITGSAVSSRCSEADYEDPMREVHSFLAKQKKALARLEKKPDHYTEILVSMMGKPSLTILEMEDLNPRYSVFTVKEVLKWAVSHRLVATESGQPTLYSLCVPILPREQSQDDQCRREMKEEPNLQEEELLISDADKIYDAVYEALRLVASIDHTVLPIREEALMDKSVTALLQWTNKLEKRRN